MSETQATQELANKRILVTRASKQASGLSTELRRYGADVIEFPTIEIAPPENWHEVDSSINNLAAYDWIVFSSANAVTHFLNRYEKVRSREQSETVYSGECSSSSKTFPCKIAVIGPSTAIELSHFQLKPDYEPVGFISESFVKNFPGYPNLAQQRILLPRTNIGREYVEHKFKAAGASVDTVVCYRTVKPDHSPELLRDLRKQVVEQTLDVITLASAQSTRNLASIIDRMFEAESKNLSKLFERTAIIAIGPETAEAAVQCFGKCDGQAVQFTQSGLIEAVLHHVQNKTGKGS